MPNSEIYSPIFYAVVHTILKIFLQHGLRKLGRCYCKKIGCWNFSTKLLTRLSKRTKDPSCREIRGINFRKVYFEIKNLD